VDRTHKQVPARMASRHFSDFIRERKGEILQDWERAVRGLPKAADLDRPALLDHVPDLLDWIAEIADQLVAGGHPEVLPSPIGERHALQRLDEGFDLAQVIAEFAVLRDCIVGLWATETRDSRFDATGFRALNQAIDKAVAASIDRYTQARDRTLRSLDRISAAALEARNLDEFLQRLLRVLLETTAAVDTATILLREGDLLVVRASVGLDTDAVNGFSLRIGEGFAGTIAKTKRPVMLRSAATDPLVISPFLRAKGVRGIYGLPLIDREDVIGVAHMGSLTAHEFSEQDKRLLLALGTRATAAISQHLLREAAEQRARQQGALAAFGHRVLGIGDTRALVEDAVRVTAETLDVEFASALELRPDGVLRFEAVHGWEREMVRTVAVPPKGESQAGYTLERRQPIIVEDMQKEERFQLSARFKERQIRSGMSVPIRVPGQPETTYGVLDAHALRLRAFTLDDVHFLEGIATLLGAAVALRRSEEDRTRLLNQAQGDRAEAERALAVVDALLSSSLIGFGFLDRDLRYVRVNDALAAINGPSAAEHLGRTVREILGHHADALEPFLRRIIDTGEPVANLEVTAAPPGTPDRTRSFLANYFPVRTPSGDIIGVGAAVVEITDRARTQQALRASEERLQRALSIDTVGVLFFSLDGRMLDANAAFERMSGYGREELREMNWQILTPPEFGDATARTAANLATVGETPPYEKQMIRPDGSRWWGLFAPTRLSGSGRESQCVEFIIDISERKHTEQALHAAMRAREEILAVVSHDLRNPLGAIHMAAALLSRKPSPDPRVRKQVETIQRSASRMDHLIGDLLDMASIQAGRLAVECKPEDPDSLVMEAVEMHEPAAKEKGLRIVRADDLQGRRLSCDRHRVQQVFSNLLGNAIKFCRSDDVITIRGEIAGNEARFAVSDTGPGIPDSELPHVFEPYWSADRHAKKGTGLGLYISKGIIEAHGGRFSVESKPGEGATFSFTLPLAGPTSFGGHAG
jgi:PAS domain S-box-containing protein